MKLRWFLFFALIISSCHNSTSNDAVAQQRPFEATIKLEATADKYYKDDEYNQATAEYDTLISINPNMDLYYFRRGYSKSMTGDYIGAKDDYLKAINIKGMNEKKAFLNMGTLYRLFGMYDSALYFYDQSIKLDSNYIKAKRERDELDSFLRNSRAAKQDLRQ